jgi:hypothetical protein
VMRWRFFIVVALLAVVGVGVLVLFIRDGATGVVTFPDGSEVEVLGAVPSGAAVSSDRPWQSTLRRFLPARWHGVLPPVSTLTCGSGNTNQLVVFFRLTPPAPWTSLVAVDDDGLRYPPAGGSCSMGGGPGTIYGVSFDAFPRRQKSFQLEFGGPEYKVIARARIANPLPLPPVESAWQAQSLPITQTNGELALTLFAVKEATNAWGSYLNPNWQTQVLDPRWKDARIGYCRVTDPVGNQGEFLSRKEKVWQLTTTGHRAGWESFDASERMLVTNLVVPAPGEMIPINQVSECAGARVTVEGLYGPGMLYVTNGTQRAMTVGYQTSGGTITWGNTTVEYCGSKKPFFLVAVTGLGDRDEFRLRLTDERGRPVRHETPGNYQPRSGSPARIYQPVVELTSEVASLSLEIVVSRAKEFVFYINPADIQPPPAK